MAPLPHFHSADQVLSAFHASLSAFNTERAACTEPTQVDIRVRLPDGSVFTLATVSVQPPPPKRRRRTTNGETWGGYHGHLLWKRPETGAVACLRRVLDADAALAAAVWAAHGVSRTGASIKHVSHLAESLADKAWAAMSAEDRLPWHDAAQRAKGRLDAVEWSTLDGALEECGGFRSFMARLEALRPDGAQASDAPRRPTGAAVVGLLTQTRRRGIY
jgi:hypothetical protein